jgi:hypothetical protein
MKGLVMSFTTSACLFLLAPIFAQDWRAELGSERAQGIELIVRVASPGAQIGWEREVTLTSADGRRRALRLPGFLRVTASTGDLLISAVEYPDDAREAVKRLKAFAVPMGTAPSLLVVAKVSRENSLRQSRTMLLHPDATATECRSIQIADRLTEESWPRLLVTYRSWHSNGSIIGSIDWEALVDVESQQTIARMPSAFWRKASNGSETGDLLRGTAISGGIELAGVRTAFRRNLQCGTPCRVDSMAVLRDER